MQLSQAKVKNFRSLRNVVVDFGAHTAFIGGNGAGKSSILKAIERFYSTVKSLDIDDYFGRDLTKTVEIELTFSNLTIAELEVFHTRVRGGQLTVTRIFDQTSASGGYFGSILLNAEFSQIRAIVGALPKRTAYHELKSSDEKYSDMPQCTSVAQVDEAMIQWENAHPDSLSLGMDDGHFFGFQNASRGALQRFTSFVFIPAVREASADAADAKASPIGRLLEILVRSAVLQRQDIAKFREDVNTKYRELTSPENMPELASLADRLTSDLRGLYADAEVGLAWRPAADMPIALPDALVTLSDDGFGGPVDRQGHGLQRAFIFTLLQQLARASTSAEAPTATGDAIAPEIQVPSLIIAIEEPELYQHPTKQRHFSQVLRRLSSGALPGADGGTQIAFASHAPLFVSIPNVDEIRFVRRVSCEDHDVKQCELRALDLSAVAAKLEAAVGKPTGTFSAASLAPRLHILGAELAEGFFADAVVLVEGRSDKAALVAAADHMGVSFESAGIAVLPVEGKGNIDRPLLIFRELGIPTYAIWDCDCHKTGKDAHTEQNLSLLRASEPDADHKVASASTQVTAWYAHFATTLEKTLQEELSEEIYAASLKISCDAFETVVGKDAQKSPDVMKQLLLEASKQGRTSTTLQAVVRAIWQSCKGIVLP